jgi:hypothetical protein
MPFRARYAVFCNVRYAQPSGKPLGVRRRDFLAGENDMHLVSSLLAGSLAALVVISPVAAHHKDGHEGGNGPKATAQNKGQGSKQSKREGSKQRNGNGGLRLGQVDRGELGEAIADEVGDCLTDDVNRVGELVRIAHAAGWSTQKLREELEAASDDDEHGRGLGRLFRGELDGDLAEELASDLEEELEDGTVTLGRMKQVIKICDLDLDALLEQASR